MSQPVFVTEHLLARRLGAEDVEALFAVYSDAAEGDRVVASWTFRGVQQGEMLGLPPTGKEVTYAGINIFRIADNKLAESWDIFDRLWLWQQLDVRPDTGEFLAAARKAKQEK